MGPRRRKRYRYRLRRLTPVGLAVAAAGLGGGWVGSHQPTTSLAAAATHVLALPADLAEDDLPFVGVLPLQWLALRLALARDENPDLVANKWVNRPLIDHSSQWGPEAYAVAASGLSGVTR